MTTTIQKSNATYIRPAKMRENRAFDYIYGLFLQFSRLFICDLTLNDPFLDKNYHLSTQQDHNTQAMVARSGTSNIVIKKYLLHVFTFAIHLFFGELF